MTNPSARFLAQQIGLLRRQDPTLPLLDAIDQVARQHCDPAVLSRPAATLSAQDTLQRVNGLRQAKPELSFLRAAEFLAREFSSSPKQVPSAEVLAEQIRQFREEHPGLRVVDAVRLFSHQNGRGSGSASGYEPG